MNKKPNMKGHSNSPKSRPNPRGSKKSWKKDEEMSDAKPTRASANDVRWYSSNAQLLKDTSSFNYERRSGDIIRFEANGNKLNTVPLYDPGIMTIYTGPSVGVSEDNTAAVNMAMRDVYSYVRHTNSGHANYDPVDLMLYLLSLDSIYTYWSWMTRVYGLMGTFSKNSKYIGDALLVANGVNASDLRAHYAEFRGFINQFAIEASRYAVPAIFTLFVRHSWMYSNVYRDSNTNRSQMYMYVPAYVYTYRADSGPGYLQAYPVGLNEELQYAQHNFTSIVEMGKALLQALATQEDIGVISGDILKAYGDDKLWKLSQIPDDYTVIPTYSEEVLMQIHNTDFTGIDVGRLDKITDPIREHDYTWTADYHALDIKQNANVGKGYLEFHPCFRYPEATCYSKILDFWKDDVTPEDSMVASRNKICMIMSNKDIGTDRIGELYACGSEICISANIWYFDLTGTAMYRPYWEHPQSNSALGDLSIYSRFNEAPVRMIFSINGAFQALIGELDKFSMISVDEMKRVHDCALLSMFNIVGP